MPGFVSESTRQAEWWSSVTTVQCCNQLEFVKLLPPGHLIRKKVSVSLTDPCRRIWPTSRTGYVWQGNLYYDIDRVFRLSAFFLSKIERYTTDAIQFAYRRVIDSPLILPPSPSLTVSLCWVVDSAPAEMRRRVLVFSTRLSPLCFNPSLTFNCTSPPDPCQRPSKQTYKNV